MTAKAAGATYEQFVAQGWTDAQLVDQGFLAPAANEARPPTLEQLKLTMRQAIDAHCNARASGDPARIAVALAEERRAHGAYWTAQRAADLAALNAQRVVPIDWSKLQGEPPPRKWLIPGWLGVSPTLMSGRGGAGKTNIMQGIATSLATGKPYIGDVTQTCNVLMWSCEDTLDDVWIQQHAINRHLQLEMPQLGRLHVVARYGHENTLMVLDRRGNPEFTKLLTTLREQVNDLRADVLSLDNIAQVFGGNLNDPHQATMFVNGIAGLVNDRPFTPILLGHVAKLTGSEFSGTMAWENAVRMRWFLGKSLPGNEPGPGDPPEDPNTAILAKRKANHTTQDSMRFQYRNGLFVPEGIGARVFNEGDRNQSADSTVLAALPQLQAVGVRVTDANNSPDYLPEQVTNKGLANNHSKKELRDAMNRMLMTGQIKKATVGYYSNRAPKEGLVVA